MSLGSVVFFEHQIVASPFEKNFHKMRCVRVAIDNQDAPSFIPEPSIERGQEKSALVVPRGRKSVSITLFIRFSITSFAGCLGRQPGDEPGAEESDHYSN